MLEPHLLDDDGFLLDYRCWNETLAEGFAELEGIRLSQAHWEVIHTIRAFYLEHDHPPAMRALVKYCGAKLGADKGRSLYLLSLFPESPARRAARIAGLPRPENCL